MNTTSQRNDLGRLCLASPKLAERLMQGYDVATLHGFPVYRVDHLLRAMCDDPAFRDALTVKGGDADSVAASLDGFFRDHAAASGDAKTARRIGSDIESILARMNEYAGECPDAEDARLAHELVSAMIAEIPGSAVCERALVAGRAGYLLPDAEIDMFFEDAFDMIDFPVRDDPEVESGPVAFDRTASRGPSSAAPVRARGRLPSEESRRPSVAPQIFVRQGPSRPDEKPQGAQKPDDVAAAVDAALRDLRGMAERGQLDPTLGRDPEIDGIVFALRRRRKSSVLLYGEAGVGKTAIAEGVAMRLRAPDTCRSLADRPFYELSMPDMVAGTKFRGDFEARMKHLIERMRDERAIVFIDEIHMLMGSGSTYGRGMDGANLIKPAMARGELTVIGATTPSEMRQIRLDAALMRRFETMAIREQDAEETQAVLDGASWTYLAHHGLTAEADVMAGICRITGRFQPEKRFPDKAFDLLDAACVTASLDMGRGAGSLRMEHVLRAADRMGIRRPCRPSPRDAARLRGLADTIRGTVFGQDDVIAGIADRVRTSAMNVTPSGPQGSMLLSGPSGCGKTHLARVFAAAMGFPFVGVDLAACRDRSAVQWLTGAPGPVGGERSGLLTDAADTHGEMCLAIENVDLTDAATHDLLTGILGSGTFRSQDGRLVSLRRAWIVMTVSGDGRSGSTSAPGFTRDAGDAADALERVLPRGLVDRTGSLHGMTFLGRGDLARVVRSALSELVRATGEAGTRLEVNPSVAATVAARASSAGDAAGIVWRGVADAVSRAMLEDDCWPCVALDVDDAGDVVARGIRPLEQASVLV